MIKVILPSCEKNAMYLKLLIFEKWVNRHHVAKNIVNIHISCIYNIYVYKTNSNSDMSHFLCSKIKSIN